MSRTVELTFYRDDTHEKLGSWFVLSTSSENFEYWMSLMGFYRPLHDPEASRFINRGNSVYAVTDEEQIVENIIKRERW